MMEVKSGICQEECSQKIGNAFPTAWEIPSMYSSYAELAAALCITVLEDKRAIWLIKEKLTWSLNGFGYST